MLGNIVEKAEMPEVELSEIGKIVEECWLAIPDHFPGVILDRYVIMPNHIHGLLEIEPESCRGTACRAPTNTTECFEKFGAPVSGSLPTIIRSFKSASTKRINEQHNTPGKSFWQRNYWEHGIRTDKELNRIQTYIVENPLCWDEDEENPKNLRNRR